MIGNGGSDTFDFSGFGSATFTDGTAADVFDYRTDAAHVTVTDFQDGSIILRLAAWRSKASRLPTVRPARSLPFHGGSDMTLTGIHASQLTQHADFIV